ncbi:MAG: hypothetical protein K2J20_05125 [Bacilli bacterium]|nr:hypothetical protein [Bacilli bacterium]
MIEQKEVKFENDGILIEGTTYIIPPNHEFGYNCGYSIFVPKKCEKNTTLLMHSCNTGNNVPIHLEEANYIAKKSTYERPNPGMWFGSDLNMPVMIPLIPRIEGYYTQSLRRKVFLSDISGLIEDNTKRNDERKISEEEIKQIQEQCKDLPSQVANMIKSAKIFLQSIGINVDDKVIAEGYSAGAQFANYFTALHPELVKACICGGNSGLGILPLRELNGQKLQYPLGIADISNFDYDAFCQTPQLYYIGTEDYNDPAMIECQYLTDNEGRYIVNHGSRVPIMNENGNVIPVLDRNGKIQPRYPESFSKEEIEIIYNYLGSNSQTRFSNQERIYSSLGVNARFQRFPGNHNTVTQNHNESYFFTNECIKDFIRSVLAKEKEVVNDTTSNHM